MSFYLELINESSIQTSKVIVNDWRNAVSLSSLSLVFNYHFDR